MRHIIFTSLLFLTIATVCKATESPYMLETGHKGQQRLDRMEEVYGHFSQSLLETLKVEHKIEPANILSVGCGTGKRERKMLKIWPNAKITAIDNNHDQIALAATKSSHLPNITYIMQDANSITDRNRYDVVYARLFLIHVNDASAVLEKMINALKPGGIIVCEEGSSSSIHCSPENEAFINAQELLQKICAAIGVDYDIGVKLESMLQKKGLSILISQQLQPDRTNTIVKTLLTESFEEAKPKVVAAGLVNEEYLDSLLKGMYKYAAEDETRISMTDLFQVVAKKISQHTS
jgi:ubiquinone/menaquinone biosynthesis C-methylase UbiE